MSGPAQIQASPPSAGWNWAAGQSVAWDDGESASADFQAFPGTTGMSDQALEALFRAQWGLPALEDGEPEPPAREQVIIQSSHRDEDEFTEEEWDMVRVLRTMCQTATRQQSPHKKRRSAVEWLFVNGTAEPRHHWTFHLMCEALRARPWVIQTMVQHLWFRRAIVPEPLPFLADVLPELLQSEAILCAWGAGETVMARVWGQPGCLLGAVRHQTALTETAFDRAVNALLEAGLLGRCADRVWVSSRSANFIRPGQRVSWSRSFPGD